MLSATLLGRHTHTTRDGSEVHVWMRRGRHLARGSHEGRRFGVTLGASVPEAEANLHDLLVRLDNGSFTRASEARSCVFRTARPGNLTMRDVADRFLQTVRKRRGAATVGDYTTRLLPVVEFAEKPLVARRWRWAHQIDNSFANDFRCALQARMVSRNGNSAAEHRRISSSHVRNILACTGTMLNWARDPRNGVLPSGFVNPFSRDFVGPPPRRDPMAPPKLPMSIRMELVQAMDGWELSVLALSLVLPVRPEELTGLLVTDVNQAEREFSFGAHGDLPTKGRTAFRIAYPPAFDGLIAHLMGGRQQGPLLRRRAIVEKPETMNTLDIDTLFQQELSRRGSSVQTPNDRKSAFQAAIRRMGGLSADGLAMPFRRLLREIRPDAHGRFYDLRGSTMTEMKNAGVDYLVRRYVTGHTVGGDIMSAYESQDALGKHLKKYFDYLEPLLDTLQRRFTALVDGASS